MKISILIFLALALQACSFQNKEQGITEVAENPNVKIIDIDKGVYKKSISFENYFNVPKTILLETNEKCLIREIQSLEIFENKIYILDSRANNLYVFDMEGNYLYQIASSGAGPGEYVQISDFTIDRNTHTIYVFDESASKVHKYNLQTKQYVSSIDVPKTGNQHFYLQYADNRLFVNETALDGKEPKHLLKMLDAESGELEKLFLDSKVYNKGWNLTLRNYHNHFYGKGTTSPKFIELFMDRIFSVGDEGITPSYIVRSKDFVTDEDVLNLVNTYYENGELYNFMSVATANKIYHIENYVESESFVYFRFQRGISQQHLFYNKQNGTILLTDNFTNDYFAKNFSMNLNFCYYDNSGAYGYIPTESLSLIKHHIIDENLLNPQIDNYESIKNIEEDSNPIIIYFPYK